MKLITKLSMFAIIIIMTACSNKDGTKEAIHPSGSDRHTFEYIKKISVTQPKQALRLLQTAENKNLMSELDINALRCLVYYNSMLDYNKATHYAEMALSDSTINSHPQQLQSILHICSLLYYNSGDYTKCLSTVKRGIDVAYKHANRKLVAQLLMIMGQCHNDIGSTWHALNCFDRAITILEKETKGKPNWSTCYYLTTANALKANALLTLKNYGKLLEQADEYKAALKSLNSMHEEINGVNDLSNATFYSIYATGYEEMGYGAKGEDMYDKLLTTRAACTTEGAALLAPYLIDKKRYAEALKKLDDMEMVWQRNGQDTVNFSYINNILTDKARALQGLGRYREAMQIGMRAYELRDSLNRRIHNQNAMMIAEQLGKQMLKHYIERQDNIVKVNHLVIAATLMLLVTCMVGLILIKRKNKILKDKEQSLLSLTEDLMKYKIKLMNLTENETSKKSGGGGGKNAMETQERFMSMEKLIIEKRLFTKPRLNRSDVADKMGMRLCEFNEMFSACSSKSFTNYINDLRMEYALKMLKAKPNYTIEAIAMECGVPIRQTFHRLFANKFGMTPAEYRNQLTKKNSTTE